MKKATKAQGNARLLKLAKLLDTADEMHLRKDEKTYRQGGFVHPCGAPSCALGHYASMFPNRFTLDTFNYYGAEIDGSIRTKRGGKNVGIDDKLVLREFAISDDEAYELFDVDGCGGAKTAQLAAAYIRKFVARRKGR